ncbi:MAG: hypothetical protein U0S50_10445 [Sphingopyxis sp.]|uniref:alpha/beta hydrolase family protein n=1 Tax=Sphingopyxis sp. TaxID=1908224 RepID=UPI002ABD0D37|nr:hypothetical protein [Sphingopyxis sp.]MDZ3832224.1 hypothetical protein [Sphingopyxis sp.]
MLFFTLALSLGGVAIFWVRSRRVRFWFAVALLLLLLTAVLSQGLRGALWPVGLWALLAVAAGYLAPVPQRRSVRLALAAAALGVGGLAGAASALMSFAPPPPTTGPYAVGSFIWPMRDTARAEYQTQDPDDRRELMVEVWYPAEAPPRAPGERAEWQTGLAANKAPYSHPEVAGAIAGAYWFPPLAPLFVDEIGRIEKPGARGVPMAPGGKAFPLLLFTPGYGVNIDYFSGLLADIASHGYVVVAVNPSHEVDLTLLPDGRRLASNDQTRQNEAGTTRAEARRIETATIEGHGAMAGLAEMKEPARRQRYFDLRRQRAAGEAFLERSIDDRVADIGFVLDTLERHQAEGPSNLLSGRIDLSRVGVFGMSLGGPTAGQFCLVDARCKAGLNFDGEIWGGQLAAMDTRIPFMWVAGWREGDDRSSLLGAEYVFGAATQPVHFVEIDHMGHMDFSDMSFMAPMLGYAAQPLALTLRGRSATLEGRRVSIDYAVAFFDRWLKGRTAPLLDAPAREGVRHRRRNPVTIPAANPGDAPARAAATQKEK